MGNSESQHIEQTQHSIYFFKTKYNWIPSFPMKEYETITAKNIGKYINTSFELHKSYIDLRVDAPPTLNTGELPLHPIATVSSMLNYQLNRIRLLYLYIDVYKYPTQLFYLGLP